MKVLIAEDDVTSRDLLEKMLTKWGYEVVSTSDGDAAFTAFQKEKEIQLGILDWEMPGMDGLTLCAKLRGGEENDPRYLILLTSRDSKRDIAMGLKAGADDYISKPFDFTELQARISVGRRVVRLQNRMRSQERLQGVLEMAGVFCSQLIKPLQRARGFSKQLIEKTDQPGPVFESLKILDQELDQISALIGKIINLTREDFEHLMKKREARKAIPSP